MSYLRWLVKKYWTWIIQITRDWTTGPNNIWTKRYSLVPFFTKRVSGTLFSCSCNRHTLYQDKCAYILCKPARACMLAHVSEISLQSEAWHHYALLRTINPHPFGLARPTVVEIECYKPPSPLVFVRPSFFFQKICCWIVLSLDVVWSWVRNKFCRWFCSQKGSNPTFWT